ncbi:unnamed protein product [Rhizophagus irregularis]|nr:unnamed protein product [Rhizophagus irregularis]CAB5318687.1 unnamed protein product [Rhizophagus irregularis]
MIQNTFSQNLAAPVPDVPEPAKTDDSAAKISGIALFKRTSIKPRNFLHLPQYHYTSDGFDNEFADVCRVAPNIERILI